jgi:hypothetical protein
MKNVTPLLMVVLALLGCNAAPESEDAPNSSSDPQHLIELWSNEHRVCWSAIQGGNAASDRGACDRALGFQKTLTSMGWCWGNTPNPTPDSEWDLCIENQTISTAAANNETQENMASNLPQTNYSQIIKVEKYFKNRVNGLGLVVDRSTYPNIKVTAMIDEVTLYGAIANRGNCDVIGNWYEGISLKFGESFEFYAVCDPIEVSINTNNGNIDINW